MATLRKAYRLPEELVNRLAERAEVDGVTATEVVTRALDAYLAGPRDGTQEAHAFTSDVDESGTREAHRGAHDDAAVAEAVRALTDQLEVKDAQIERLGTALSQAQALAHAAQALEGAQVAKALGDGGETDTVEHRRGIVSRLRDLFK